MTDKDTTALQAEQAAHTFPLPFGCAQAIASASGYGTDQALMELLGALSGGIGGCGLTCGAFIGGAMILQSNLRRYGLSQQQCNGLIDELRLEFELADGTTVCHELTGMRFGDAAVINSCRARIARTIKQMRSISERYDTPPATATGE